MSQDLPIPARLKFVVIDDHELLLDGTLNVLRQQYPQSEILTAQTAQIAIEQVENAKPDLVVLVLMKWMQLVQSKWSHLKLSNLMHPEDIFEVDPYLVWVEEEK